MFKSEDICDQSQIDRAWHLVLFLSIDKYTGEESVQNLYFYYFQMNNYVLPSDKIQNYSRIWQEIIEQLSKISQISTERKRKTLISLILY